jgi:hypothetical protein
MIDINWKEIILNLKDGVEVMPEIEKKSFHNINYTDILNIWKKSNFNLSSVKWINFYPELHFPRNIETLTGKDLNITPLRSWISKIDPGFCAPWHWDVDENEDEYLKKGTLIRASCFIQDPTPGHIFQIEDQYYYNLPCGEMILWEHHRQWHAAANFGLVPKYMYHILGFTNC